MARLLQNQAQHMVYPLAGMRYPKDLKTTFDWKAGIWLLAPALASAAAPELPGPDILASVSSLDVYADRNALHVLLAGKSRQTGRPIALYLRSKDGGRHWSEPRQANRDERPAVDARPGNDAQIAAAGNTLLAAWQERGAQPGSGPIAVAYSEDGGLNWQAGGNPAGGDATQNQSHLDLLADAKGQFHIIWLDDREENGNAQGLRHAYSTDNGRHWQAEATLDSQVCTCCWNRLAALPDGELAVLYRDQAPHDMALARRDAGAWQRVGPVGAFHWQFYGCPHCGGGMATGGHDGKTALHAVVWTGAPDAGGLYYLQSHDRGVAWSEPLRIGDVRARAADVAALSEAHLAVAYAQSGPDGSRIDWIQSRNGGISWSAPATLAPAAAMADSPRILATPFGFRAFWTESNGAGGKRWRIGLL